MGDQFSYALSSLVNSHVNFFKFYLADISLSHINSYFTFQPKPELKVVSNVPVISVEEVAPVSVSDAMMLAPEEVHEKKNEQKGKTELTDTDRKRERRAKKRRQHERAVEKTK